MLLRTGAARLLPDNTRGGRRTLANARGQYQIPAAMSRPAGDRAVP
jgi:hypothetical protein